MSPYDLLMQACDAETAAIESQQWKLAAHRQRKVTQRLVECRDDLNHRRRMLGLEPL